MSFENVEFIFIVASFRKEEVRKVCLGHDLDDVRFQTVMRTRTLIAGRLEIQEMGPALKSLILRISVMVPELYRTLFLAI